MPSGFKVTSIPKEQTYDWLLKKHYAKRRPNITHAYGLYDDHGILSGVCTYGMTPNYKEMQAWHPFRLLELNRLVVKDDMPKNSTSYFVGQTLKQLPRPLVLISYADLTMGHYGYIYQATNWIFTGISGEGANIYVMADGSEQHQRSVDIGDGGIYKRGLLEKGEIKEIKKTEGKARYYYFLGDKKEKKEMRKLLRFPVLPYPKGDNKRYDASYQPNVQQTLFL